MRLTLGDYNSKKNKKENGKDDKDNMPAFATSKKAFVIEIIKIVVITLAIIIPVRYFLFQPFYVRGASMEPNFYDNEYLIIDEITYRFSEPKRGDVVVVKDPKQPSEYFIKRIIGLPEETLVIQNGLVYITNSDDEGKIMIDEDYLGDEVTTSGNITVQLTEDQYYILGDNRTVSLDSRSFGPVDEDLIIGRAWLRVWPFDKFQHFISPEYNLQY